MLYSLNCNNQAHYAPHQKRTQVARHVWKHMWDVRGFGLTSIFKAHVLMLPKIFRLPEKHVTTKCFQVIPIEFVHRRQ